MNKRKIECSSKLQSFRFGSGQILKLSDQQINQIPYLLGLVSFAEYSKTVFDQDGNLKLDPKINFNHFLIIIDILPIRSASQSLIHLPQHQDSLEIMLLIDYLGLLPSPQPTLAEIDSMFLIAFANFSMNRCYDNKKLNTDLTREMAAHFAFNLIKDDYNQADDQLIYKIQWCSMVIIHANRFFHPIIRYYVYKASEYFFRVFRPSLLPCLRPVTFTSGAINNVAIHETEIRHFICLPRSAHSVGKMALIRFLLNDDRVDTVDLFRPGSNDEYICALRKTTAESVSYEVFNTVEKEIWLRCAGTRITTSSWMVESQIEPSLSRIRELSLLSDTIIKTEILKEIFEHPSVHSRIRESIIDRVPNYIHTMCQGSIAGIDSWKKYLEWLQAKLISLPPGLSVERFIRRFRLDLNISEAQKYIAEYQKVLQELDDVQHVIDDLCDSTLIYLYRLGISQIRVMIDIRLTLADLEEKENVQRKFDREKRKFLKTVGKSRQSSVYKPTTNFPMKNCRWKH